MTPPLYPNFAAMRGGEGLVIGSCALQAHLRTSHRLPNDIDVVIFPECEQAWLRQCEANGIEVCLKPGRRFLQFSGVPIHVLGGGMWLVDFQTGTLFDFIPIDPLADKAGEKRFSLLTTRSGFMLPVPSLELLFALTLLRPMNANSFLDCRAMLETGGLNAVSLAKFGRRSSGMRQILLARLPEFARYLTSQRTPIAKENASVVESARRSLV